MTPAENPAISALRAFVMEAEATFSPIEWTNVRLHGQPETPWLKLGNLTAPEALTSILKRLNKTAMSVSLVQNGPHVEIWGREASGSPARLAHIINADLAIWIAAHAKLVEKGNP